MYTVGGAREEEEHVKKGLNEKCPESGLGSLAARRPVPDTVLLWTERISHSQCSPNTEQRLQRRARNLLKEFRANINEGVQKSPTLTWT